LVWIVGKVDRVRIGEDPWMGCIGNYRLLGPLKYVISNLEIHIILDTIDPWPSFIWNQVCKSTTQLKIQRGEVE